MILLASGTALIARHGAAPWFGQLICPRGKHRVVTSQWAADNAAFSCFDPVAYRTMLDKIRGLQGTQPPPIFVTVPDVVGDAYATRHKFADWSPILQRLNIPAGYVLQDGERIDFVPWDCITSVFIGGTTAFKMGGDARRLVDEAHRRGKWVHMGRVNSIKRIKYAQQIGCDSVDGSGFARFANAMVPLFILAEMNGRLPHVAAGKLLAR